MYRIVRNALAAALLATLVVWLALAALTTLAWCQPHDFGACLQRALLVSGVVGVLPALVGAFGVGSLVMAVRALWRR